MVHLSTAEYSAELFHKIFCHNVACDIIKSMALDFTEYFDTAEQGPGWQLMRHVLKCLVYLFKVDVCQNF